MADVTKPYKPSTFKTFRRRCMNRIVHISDMRHTIFIRYAKAVGKKIETAAQLNILLDKYDALIEAEKVFLEYLSKREGELDGRAPDPGI